MHEIAERYLHEIGKSSCSVQLLQEALYGFLKDILSLFNDADSLEIISNNHDSLPTLRIEKDGIITGYIDIELSFIDSVLKKGEKSIRKYPYIAANLMKASLNGFRLSSGNIDEKAVLFVKEDLLKNDFRIDSSKISLLMGIFKKFISSKPSSITKSRDLALELSARASVLRNYLIDSRKDKNDFSREFAKLFNKIRGKSVQDLDYDDFADACCQLWIYGAFLAYMNGKAGWIDERLSLHIDSRFHIFTDILQVFESAKIPLFVKIIQKEAVGIINSIHRDEILRDISRGREKASHYHPYIYFYEEFLRTMDPLHKKDRGVYYTPIPVVRYIINSLDKILKNKLDMPHGLESNDTAILDFATGTGIFLMELFKFLQEKGIRKDIMNNSITGFEFMFVPYVVVNLVFECLFSGSEFTESNSRKKPYYNIILKNTLDDAVEVELFPFSDERKCNQKTLVIMGNPPYNVKSKNKNAWIKDLLELYKPSGEKKLNWDDYIKFIRFAHFELEKSGKGAIGIITNSSFINAVTLRKMRRELCGSFDFIYVLDLHGDKRHLEKREHGLKDDNIFDIKQGVAITFFIKNAGCENRARIYYSDLFGSRDEKLKFLEEHDISDTDWISIEPDEFDSEFSRTRWSRKIPYFNLFEPMKNNVFVKNYGEYWGLNEIFKDFASGVKSDRNELMIDIDEDVLAGRMTRAFSGDFDDDFREKYRIYDSGHYSFLKRLENLSFSRNSIKRFMFRPYDERFIYYEKGFTSNPAEKVMKHISGNENIALAFTRYVKSEIFPVFVTDILTDCCFLNEWTYFAPLYLYGESTNEKQGRVESNEFRIANFNKEFLEFILSRYKHRHDCLEILGYIYAVLNSSIYVNTFLEFLKIDYPRIPFIDDEDSFSKLSFCGIKLIYNHLQRSQSAGSEFSSGKGKSDGSLVQRISYKDSKLHISGTSFFKEIPLDLWKYNVGGYEVIRQWLKSRQGRMLEEQDLAYLSCIFSSINETIRIKKEIDELTAKLF